MPNDFARHTRGVGLPRYWTRFPDQSDWLLRMALRRRKLGLQLHESTSRGLCRLAFILFGVLPLLVCFILCGVQYVPTYHRWRAGLWEDWLSSTLGVDVEVAALEAMAPGRFTLHGIRLKHPETGASIGRVRLVEVELNRRGQWIVRLAQPELEGRQLSAAWKIVHDWYLCRPQHYARAVQIGMNDLTIHGAIDGTTFNAISVEMDPLPDTLELTINFRVANSLERTDKGKPVDQQRAELVITRHHSEEHPMTELELTTGAAPLPCSLLSGLLPQLEALGTEASFEGKLRFQMGDNTWVTRITNGTLNQVDFGRMGWYANSALSGVGGIVLEKASIRQDGLSDARGVLWIRSGRITHSLLTAIGRNLAVDLSAEVLEGRVGAYPFEEAGFCFEIEPTSLRLYGGLVDAVGPLATRAQERWDEEPLPLERLVWVLRESSINRSTDAGHSPVPGGWLAKQAILWLPLEEPDPQIALAPSLRPSDVR